MASLSCLVKTHPITERLYLRVFCTLQESDAFIPIDAGPMVASEYQDVVWDSSREGRAGPIFTEPRTGHTQHGHTTGHRASCSTILCIKAPILLMAGRALGLVVYSAQTSAMISKWFLDP